MCSMEIDPAIIPSVYKSKTYYFCSQDHKTQFDSAPQKFVAMLEKR
jgi:YHS domain-containing protein